MDSMGTYEKWGLVATLYEEGVPVSDILRESGYADRSTVKGIVRRMGLQKRGAGRPRTNHFNEGIFESIESAEGAYWFGYVTTDGAIVTRKNADGSAYSLDFRLAIEDGERVYAFAQYVHADPDSVYTLPPRGRQKQPAVGLRLSSKRLVASLIEMGVIPNRKLESQVTIPAGFEADFWRGVFDADGYVSMAKGALRVAGIVSSRHLTEGLRDFAKAHGVQSRCAIYENQGGLGRAVQWKCSSQDATRLRDALYPNGDECEHLARKKVLLDKVADTYPL